jgi:hypothetical protein
MDELSAAIQKVGAAMYQQAPNQGAAGAEGAASNSAAGDQKKDGPVDAEVVE